MFTIPVEYMKNIVISYGLLSYLVMFTIFVEIEHRLKTPCRQKSGSEKKVRTSLVAGCVKLIIEACSAILWSPSRVP